jgi:hypothetical protein
MSEALVRAIRIAKRAGVLAFACCLSGCYQSKTDLIGEHSTPITRLDSIIIFRDAAYFAASVGDDTILCPLNARSDVGKLCTSPYHLKIERLEFGDYLIQIRQFDDYHFGIWHRSLKNDGFADNADNCLMILGEDIIGENITSMVMGIHGRGVSLHDGEPRFDQLRDKLGSFQSKMITTRSDLLAIAQIYEDTVYFLGKPSCPGDTIHFGNHQLIHIRGDNRDLPVLE